MSKIDFLTKYSTTKPSSARGRARARRAVRAPRLLLAIATLWFAGIGATRAQIPDDGFEILPATPRALQPVYARVMLPACRAIAEVKHAQGIISIGVTAQIFCIPSPVMSARDVSLGKLPQGQYRARLVNADVSNASEPEPEIAFEVAAPTPGANFDDFGALLDYSGLWWNPEHRGQGWFVEHHVPDRLVLTWVTYDEAGRNTWYVMQADSRSYEVISGPVYKAQRTGTGTVLTQIGSGRFASFAAGEAVFTLLPNGADVPTVINLHRTPL